MVGWVETGGESVHRVAGAGELGELLREREDVLPELVGALCGDPGVAKGGAELVGLVRGDGFGCSLGQWVDADSRTGVSGRVDRATRKRRAVRP